MPSSLLHVAFPQTTPKCITVESYCFFSHFVEKKVKGAVCVCVCVCVISVQTVVKFITALFCNSKSKIA